MLSPVIVDDYFPTRFGKPIFAVSQREGEIWPMIIEKAWAKVHGSYSKILYGYTQNAFVHLSGTPSLSIYHPANL